MFSVIITLYNKAHMIEGTLNSVLDQTFKDYEVIIIDDGSTDNALEIINRNEKYSAFRIIKQLNQGASVARNNGIANSKFNYVALLDGDDEWTPIFLETISKAILEYPIAGIYGTSSWHKNILTGEKSDGTPLKYKGKTQIFDFFENPVQMPHTSAIVLNKKIFNSVFVNGEGFPSGMKVCEDWACFYRIAFDSSVVYIGYPLGIRNNNVKGQITSASKLERTYFLTHIIKFYNLTYTSWENSKTKPKKYKRFLVFELRGRVIGYLITKDYNTLNNLLNGLIPGCRNELNKFELKIYSNLNLRYLSLCYIYYTKISWRINKFKNIFL